MNRLGLFIVLSFLFCSACSSDVPPLGFNTDITPKMIKNMPAPLDLPEALDGGPLYVFDVDAPDPTLRAYRRLRLARAEEIIGMMDEESERLLKLLKDMPEYRAVMIRFMGQLAEKLGRSDKELAELGDYAFDAIKQQTADMFVTTASAVRLEALSKSIEDLRSQDKNKFVNNPTLPMLQYVKWEILNRLVDDLTKEYASSQAKAGGIIAAIEANKDKFDKKVRKLSKKYDDKIGGLVKDMDKEFLKVIGTHLEVMAGFESLKAADYAFTMAMLEFTKKAMPDISKRTGEVKTGDVVSEEDKEFLVSNAHFLTVFTDEMRKGMESSEPPPAFRYIAGRKSSGLIPPFLGVAYAGAGSDFLDNAAYALKSSVREMGTGLYGIGKTVVNGTYENARKVQAGVGNAVNYANQQFGVGMNHLMSWSYGNTRQDELEMVARTRARAEHASSQGKQGADVLRTGRDYLDSVEKGVGSATRTVVGGAFDVADYAADKATGGEIRNVWGRDQVSWVAGKVGELTAGMATGFGKGIMNLTNPDASREELLEGTIDTVFAFIGGSKAAVKTSQVMAGARKAGQEVSEKFVSWESREALKRESAELAKSSARIMSSSSMTGQELAMLCDNTRRIMANELREKALKDAEKSIAQILSGLASKTGEKIVQNIDDAGQGAKDFVSKSVDGGLGALKSTFFSTKTEALDNIAGSQADNFLKDFTKWMVLPDQDADAMKKAVAEAALKANLNPDDPKDKEAIEKIQKVIEEGQKKMAKVEEEAEEKAKEQAIDLLTKQMLKEEKSALMTPVKASGSFSGKYKGSVSITLTPGGGPVNGTVTTEFGTADINGNVGSSGTLSASISGTMYYDWYADGFNATKKSCSLGGSVSGNVSNRRVSGTYSATCGNRGGSSGKWTASW